jgi:hypothetical protein
MGSNQSEYSDFYRRPDAPRRSAFVHSVKNVLNLRLHHSRPDDVMDWRAVSRSRSRISMEWRAGSRSRSRPPWETSATAARLDANETHSHALLGRREVGGPIPEEAYASPSRNSTSVPIPIRPAAARSTSPPPPPPAFHHSLGYMPHAHLYGPQQGEGGFGGEEAYFPRRVRKTSFDHTVTRPDYAGLATGAGRHQYNGRPVGPVMLRVSVRIIFLRPCADGHGSTRRRCMAMSPPILYAHWTKL